jgi:hypothetical protein
MKMTKAQDLPNGIYQLIKNEREKQKIKCI